MQKTNSKGSLFSQQRDPMKKTRQDTIQLCQNLLQTMEEASKTLPHIEFTPIFQKTMKYLIFKAEVESPNFQSICLQSIKQCLSLYGGSLQLNMRALLLEILSELNCNILQEIPIKLNKAKHIVLQTQIEYLLSKIFLLQEKYFILMNDEVGAMKSLRKCLQLNQDHMVQFMQEEQQIRKQIVDYAIVAYYQCFKISKDQKPVQSLQHLLKACNAAKKNYGKDSKVTKGLFQMYGQQQNLMNSIQKVSVKSRAVTDIFDYESKKNYRTVAFYSWEDERIVVQLLKIKGKDRQVVSQTSYDIKLDMSKIKLLRSNDWLTVQKGGQIIINEDELLRILGFNNNESNQKQMTTGIQLRNLSKEQIIKKAFLSSSEDDEQFFSKQQLNILKFPRAQSSRKFKQTQ